jgi:hypothetical protein
LSIFSLKSYKDLLSKCNQEYQELLNCSSHPEYEYILINIIFGLNHLFDWCIKDTSISKKKCIETFNPYREKPAKDLASIYKENGFQDNNFIINVNQEVIRHLCNKSKHFKLIHIETRDKNYTCLAGSISMECGESRAECGEFDGYAYFVDIEGENKNLLSIISELLKQWNDFAKCN